MIGVLIRREDAQTKGRKHHDKTQIKGECCMTTEAETIVTQLI